MSITFERESTNHLKTTQEITKITVRTLTTGVVRPVNFVGNRKVDKMRSVEGIQGSTQKHGNVNNIKQHLNTVEMTTQQ